MVFYIKNMISRRCEMVVMEELQKIGVLKEHIKIDIGTVILQDTITQNQQEAFKANLLQTGLELIESKRDILVESIIKVIIQMIDSEELPPSNYADYIGKQLHHDYTYLANIFSETKNVTIQQYIIRYKIDKVKELLLYNELTLTSISNKLHYSSVAHLSNQFKKVTGTTPSLFLKQEQDRLATLKKVGNM